MSEPGLCPVPVWGEHLLMHTGEGPGPLCTQAASVVLSQGHLAAFSAVGQASVLWPLSKLVLISVFLALFLGESRHLSFAQTPCHTQATPF